MYCPSQHSQVRPKPWPGFNFATVNTYDALDRVLQVTDPRSLVTQSPRNGLGDVTQLVSADTGTTSFTSYDAAGNLTTRTTAAACSPR